MNWDQLRTLLWLRWRLTRNQWSRGGSFNAVLSAIAAFAALGISLAGGLAGFLVGALSPVGTQPSVVLWIWDGLVIIFLVLWIIGLLTEIQRADTLDLGRLLHLPMSLRDAFLINYLASHFSLSLVLIAPIAFGFTFGLAFGAGPRLLLLAPVVAGFFFMITAWTYRLRGWLASLMANQRRRRAIVMGITLGVILFFQLPNLIINVWWRPMDRHQPGATRNPQQEKAELLAYVDAFHRYLPPLWLPASARSLTEGTFSTALASAAFFSALGALGLRSAYRTTVRAFQGADSAKPASRPADPAPTTPRGPLLVERRIRGLPEEAAAIAFATLRSMLRAPEVKMAMILNLVIFAVMGSAFVFRAKAGLPPQAQPFIATGIVAATYLGLMQVLFNQFGFDRDGFRALVLLPARRRDILLGKNLALLPFAALTFFVLLALMIGFSRSALGPGLIFSTLLQFVAGYFLMCFTGNLYSILAPYRIAQGTLKPSKTHATTSLFILIGTVILPLMMSPLFLPSGIALLWSHLGLAPRLPVQELLSLLVLAGAAALYLLTLDPIGRFLQLREQKILDIVTHEVE